jgi:hypothetical protein
MSNSENPYQPQAMDYTTPAPTIRPATATVFGILNIIWGLMGFCSNVISIGLFAAVMGGAFEEEVVKQMGPQVSNPTQLNIVMVQLAIGVLISIGLISAGIGLLKFKAWGRTASNVCAVVAIVQTVLGIAFMVFTGPAFSGGNVPPEQYGALIGGICGGVLGLAFPICSLIFLNRPAFVQAIRDR